MDEHLLHVVIPRCVCSGGKNLALACLFIVLELLLLNFVVLNIGKNQQLHAFQEPPIIIAGLRWLPSKVHGWPSRWRGNTNSYIDAMRPPTRQMRVAMHPQFSDHAFAQRVVFDRTGMVGGRNLQTNVFDNPAVQQAFASTVTDGDRDGDQKANNLPPVSERVFLVTGSTDGIGKSTVEHLAQLGCTVLVHGRTLAKIQATLDELQELAPHNAKLYGYQADLSDMSQVRKLASDVSANFPVIHGLLNNAGTFDGDYTGKRKVTPEGNEYSLAVNVMAPFLLTSLLIDNVRASGAGRILITSSSSMVNGGDALDDLQLEQGWEAQRAYALSKLCDAMMLTEMKMRYGDPPRLCFHTVDPGIVDTKMLRAGWWTQDDLTENGNFSAEWASARSATTSFELLTDDSYQEDDDAFRAFVTTATKDDYGGLSDRDYSLLGELTSLGIVSNHQKKAKAVVLADEVYDKNKRAKLWDDLVALTGAKWPHRVKAD